tara:strand:- start:2352 stop:3194 length:843 start_codon:yes stop_codon:yes gene_type:complete
MRKNLYMFDMDGTLTPHRQPIEKIMVESLVDLIKSRENDNHIAIVSGSDLDYIFEQCLDLFNEIYSLSTLEKNKIRIFPCNGTKEYQIKDDDLEKASITLVSQKNMRDEIGIENYNLLLRLIMQIQLRSFSTNGILGSMDLSGTFMQYRNSLLNWCPIGRDCTNEERERFIKLDSKNHIREQLIYELEHCIYLSDLDNLVMSMGGQTSIDIHPHGWDKTIALTGYSLNYFNSITFMGDRCSRGQNDFTIYEAVKILDNGRSFEVSSPQETMKLIELRELS